MSRSKISNFAFGGGCENTLQRLMLISLSDCPDPAGGDWVTTSVQYLSEFCVAPIDEIEKQLKRLHEMGVIRSKRPPDSAADDEICFVGGDQ